MKNFNKIFLAIILFTGFIQNQNLVCMEGPDSEEKEISNLLEATNVSNFAFFEQMPDDLIKASIYDLTFKILDPNNKDLSIEDALKNAYRLSRINRRFRNLLHPLIEEIDLFYNDIAANIIPEKTLVPDLLEILKTRIALISPSFKILAQNLISEIDHTYCSPSIAKDFYAINFFIAKHSCILKNLLDRGLNPNMVDPRQYTLNTVHGLLHSTILDGGTQSTALLLKYGANPNLKFKKEYRSPLFIAIHHQLIETVKLLLEYGADPTVDLYYCTHRWELVPNSINEQCILRTFSWQNEPDGPTKDWYLNELIPLLEEYSIIYKQNKTCCTIQ